MTTLPHWLHRSSANYPNRLAMTFEDTTWTFRQLFDDAYLYAGKLAASGVSRGQFVALLAGNSADYALVVHALTLIGAVLVPLNTRLTHDELRWQLQDVTATTLIYDAPQQSVALALGADIQELSLLSLISVSDPVTPSLQQFQPMIFPVQEELDLDSTQAIIYTSGTTGQPKGATITYGMQWWSAIGSALNLEVHDDDLWLACLPLFHVGGLTILMRGAIYGMGVMVFDRFTAAAVNQAILTQHVTIVSVVTVMVQRMLADIDAQPTPTAYPPSLRCLLLGGGPAPVPLLEDCAARNIPVVQTYGMTETCSQAVTLAPSEALKRIGSAGRPLAQLQMQIVQHNQPVPTGAEGEIWLRGPSITPGYHRRPEATQQAFHDGWFATGDIGYLDDDGYLYVLDRRSDLIISGGENIYPAQIEAALLRHPDVIEAGVCGIADAAWGQVPVAFVRVAQGSTVTEAELLTFLTSQLAKFKLPHQVIFTDELPRTASGKILRRELAKLLPLSL